MAKILVVDDEVHITSLLKLMLEARGFEVATAHDGIEALEKVAADPPDLILLDIRMPRLDGLGVCERLKSNEKTRGIAIVMVTAFTQKETRQRSLDLGADDFICKPFEPSTLINCVERILRIPRSTE